jgi:hypothetical protein
MSVSSSVPPGERLAAVLSRLVAGVAGPAAVNGFTQSAQERYEHECMRSNEEFDILHINIDMYLCCALPTDCKYVIFA